MENIDIFDVTTFDAEDGERIGIGVKIDHRIDIFQAIVKGKIKIGIWDIISQYSKILDRIESMNELIGNSSSIPITYKVSMGDEDRYTEDLDLCDGMYTIMVLNNYYIELLDELSIKILETLAFLQYFDILDRRYGDRYRFYLPQDKSQVNGFVQMVLDMTAEYTTITDGQPISWIYSFTETPKDAQFFAKGTDLCVGLPNMDDGSGMVKLDSDAFNKALWSARDLIEQKVSHSIQLIQQKYPEILHIEKYTEATE